MVSAALDDRRSGGVGSSLFVAVPIPGPMRRTILLALAVLVVATSADAAPRYSTVQASLAGLQVALIREGLYPGPVDGLSGPDTTTALLTFERSKKLPESARMTRAVRAALGSWGRYDLDQRVLSTGARGWDVAELQFLLAWHGFPSALFTGTFNTHVKAALERYQTWAHLTPDGIAGNATLASLRSTPVPHCPIALAWPVRAPISSPFGPRGFGFHTGIDIAGAFGTPVGAAARGKVVWAGPMSGGWGKLVIVSHSRGVESLYAHLSRVDVTVGQAVSVGDRLGLVGSTGDAVGPHLHFEVRVRGAAVDPLPALAARR
jgi:murein DD-endopeptidase MepM/ murein hydrolase activator NlpD